MSRSTFSILLFFLLLFSGCMTRQEMICNLRCENLNNPLGIDTIVPRFSWKVRTQRNGMLQSAYQIIMASDSMLLDEEKADLWNSGKTLSSACVLIPYQGEQLTSRSLVYWKVRIWDEQDKMSDWSRPSRFSVGLLDTSDWHASYIGLWAGEGIIQYPQLRKTFNLAAISGSTFLHVNSLGYHEVYLNGKKVGEGVLNPAMSQFDKRSLILTYDVTPYVKEGRNDLVLWLGRGWYRKGLPGAVCDGPLVRAQLEQIKGDTWKLIAFTDTSWTGRSSEYSGVANWESGNFGGESVDGSRSLPDLSAESLDMDKWVPAVVVDVPEHKATPQMTEINRIVRTFSPDTIYSLGKNTWLVDIGTTLTGWAEVRFQGLSKGQCIMLEYSDRLDQNGLPPGQNQNDLYYAAGNDQEVFRSKFNYHGFRYIKISNLARKPNIDDISAYLIHTDYSPAATFECSDADLNRIHDMIQYTLRCLSLGGYLVDCPQFERLGYGGDGNASTQTAQTMFDLMPLYTNWLQAWSDCIREDGGMPHTAPCPYPAGGGPYWCGFIITASWKSYVNYGDIRILEKYYPVMQKWLGYVEKYSPDIMLQPWPETDYRVWYLGDWASPLGVNDRADSSVCLVTNCFIVHCYNVMAKIAGVLGKPDDGKKYTAQSTLVRERIHQTCFNPYKKTYGSGSQMDLSYALLSEVVPDSLKPQITANLKHEISDIHKGHIACGLVGIPVFVEWAVENRAADLVYTMLKKQDYPGYLYMIDNGATTTWEHWNGARSRIHNCYNGIGSWFYQAVGGIRQIDEYPGYQKVIIDPQIPQGVTWANISKETPYGNLVVNWKLNKGKFQMNIKVPVGCTASILVPDYVTSYRIDEKTVKSKNAETSVVELESGNYQISYAYR